MKQNTAQKKILVISSTFPRWEDDVEPPFVYELCRRLNETFIVHVLAPHASGAAIETHMDGIEVTRYRYFFSRFESLAYQGGIPANLKQNPLRYGLIPFFFLSQLLAFIRLLNRCRYDCIHAHWLIPQGLIVLVARLYTKSTPPLIVTSHGADLFSLKGFVFDRLKRYVALHSNAVTVVSHAMQKILQEMGISLSKVKVIPMGVDLQNRFVPAAKQQKTGVILFVGRLVKKKGLVYLIESLPSIIEHHPHSILRIVGDGQEKERIKKRIIELDLCNHIEFLGAIGNDALPEIYRTADVVVFPSVVAEDGDQEGFGLVLVEALGCECATVVTDLPAMQDIVHNGKTALVVPQKDPMQIAEKVNCLLDDEKMAKTLGRQGRAYVLHRFDWEVITRRYTDLIHSVIG